MATIPGVLVRSCTRVRIGRSLSGAPFAGRRVYWKVTGKDSVLLAVFFSPGTGWTVAVTV